MGEGRSLKLKIPARNQRRFFQVVRYPAVQHQALFLATSSGNWASFPYPISDSYQPIENKYWERYLFVNMMLRVSCIR